jgi:ABC-2 type transport system permease protein
MSQPEPATGEPVAGAIYDIGYQHYDGKRLGRAGAVRALYVQGLRTVFGVGRGGKAKVPPIALIAIMVIPAVIQAALAGLGGGQFQVFTHDGYFRTTVWIFGLFCAFQTPELVTGDQQHRVLALYFSRALLRPDYVLARVGALATALFVVALLPHAIMLLGEYFAAEHVGDAIKASLPMIPRIVGSALALAILLSTVSITISAIIKRRPFATAAILALFLLASAFVTPLVMSRPDKMRYLVLASPMMVGEGLTNWIFDTTTVRAPVDSTLFTPLPPLGVNPDSASIAARRTEMRRRFRQRRQVTVVGTANLPGVVYLATAVGLILLGAGVLTLRYRSIET